ncbi:hypothetical protein KL86PLE_90750 [uncultured Pleomorphomonas sp.]|uniref:Uncharacterized protein n=1 Tax=uncultured Pleomorphomonas sp. TaxID=442121 RepID=A0A212LR45_9HYPH|nr:hypothetical protein [uncultured Pleomorphomonas sp.]SCM80003.1 hypothetical protein KL86PLE_90750 [uncultured Pleomorphomonas sp.]
MAYDDAASQAALTVAKSVLQDAVKAAGVVKAASQTVAAAVAAAEQMLPSKADKDLSNVEADAVAALVGKILFSATHDGEGAPATLALRPVAEGSTIYGMFLVVPTEPTSS